MLSQIVLCEGTEALACPEAKLGLKVIAPLPLTGGGLPQYRPLGCVDNGGGIYASNPCKSVFYPSDFSVFAL